MESFMKVFIAAVIFLTVMFLVGCGGGATSIGPPTQLSFTSVPSTAAGEGQPYTYTMTVSDSGSAVTFHVLSAPTGATLSGDTVTWTPTTEQARTLNAFSVSATAGSAVANQSWSLTPVGTIQGTRIVSYITDAGTTQIPEDTTQMAIAAFAPNGKSGFTTIEGTGSTDGTFSIRGVPGGYYWLHSGAQNYVWTNRSAIDTGYDTLGTPSRTYPTMETELDLNLTGLNPWQSGDEQQLYVPNINAWLAYDWELQDGATNLFQQVPWTDPLLDAGKGDTIYVTQLVTTPTAAGLAVNVLGAAAPPINNITQPDGTEVELDTALDDVEAEASFRGNIAGADFAQLESGVNPSAVPDSSYLYFDVQPGGTDHGWIGTTPDLVAFDGTDEPIRTNIDMGDIAYANPFPQSWAPFLDYVHYVRIDYTAPGATNSTTQYAYLEVQTTDLPNVNTPLAPAIGPIGSPTINGSSLFSRASSVGTMPTLSWTQPSLGSPTGYEIEVFHLYSDGNDSFTELAGDLFTATTSVQIPPGVLTSGNSYYFRISAVFEPGTDYTTTPFRHGFPRAVAQSLSGVVTP
jgi:hypothetical protein